MKIVHFNQTDADLWNQFVDHSPEAWLFHRVEWVKLEAFFQSNESFMITSDQDKPLGIFCVYRPIRRRNSPLEDCFLNTGNARGGPATASDLSEKQRDEVMMLALTHLRNRAKRCGANRLEVRLPTLAPAYLPPFRSDMSPLWKYGFTGFPIYGAEKGLARLRVMDTPTTIVELTGRDEEILFAECSHACRNVIRKGIRAGATCVENDSHEGLEEFYATYEASFRRSRTQTRTLSFFRDLYDALMERGLMKIFIAHYQGRPVASAIILCYKGSLTYFAGGFDYEARSVSPHNLLIWETLRWARSNGWKWYEIGPFFPYLPKNSKMGGIGNFKRQFGGKAYVQYEGTMVYSQPRYVVPALAEEFNRQLHLCRSRVVRLLKH